MNKKTISEKFHPNMLQGTQFGKKIKFIQLKKAYWKTVDRKLDKNFIALYILLQRVN
jgi:hypothetical protein